MFLHSKPSLFSRGQMRVQAHVTKHQMKTSCASQRIMVAVGLDKQCKLVPKRMCRKTRGICDFKHNGAHTCRRVEMVRHGQGECNKEVLCTTAEQVSVRLGTGTKHPEVQNLFS